VEDVGGDVAIDRHGLLVDDQPHGEGGLHPAVGGHFRSAAVGVVPEHQVDHQQTKRNSQKRRENREDDSQNHGLVLEEGWTAGLSMMQMAKHREIHQSQQQQQMRQKISYHNEIAKKKTFLREGEK
jgi:hypothetical protein